MPQKPTCPTDPAETEADNSGTAENVQKERRYYYDDAHGYEDFDPESEMPEDDEGEPV